MVIISVFLLSVFEFQFQLQSFVYEYFQVSYHGDR